MKLTELRARYALPEPIPVGPVQLDLDLEVERIACLMVNCGGFLKVHSTMAVYMGQLVYRIVSPCYECEVCSSIYQDDRRPGVAFRLRGELWYDGDTPANM